MHIQTIRKSILKSHMENNSEHQKQNTKHSHQTHPNKRGIFQGDFLSAFGSVLYSVPCQIFSTKEGYKVTGSHPHTISHLIYMYDLKLYASTTEQLNNVFKVTETYDQDIQMKVGIDKCKIDSIINGKHSIQEECTLRVLNIIQNMDIY